MIRFSNSFGLFKLILTWFSVLVLLFYTQTNVNLGSTDTSFTLPKRNIMSQFFLPKIFVCPSKRNMIANKTITSNLSKVVLFIAALFISYITIACVFLLILWFLLQGSAPYRGYLLDWCKWYLTDSITIANDKGHLSQGIIWKDGEGGWSCMHVGIFFFFW